MADSRFAAVDLGASSGRVIAATVGAGQLHLQEAHRFVNGPVELPDGLHWDILGLYREVLTGLRRAGESGSVAGIGIDSWGVDYGLLGPGNILLGNPFHYRDPRSNAYYADGDLLGQTRVGGAELFRANGLQHMPINTVYQLAAERSGPLLPLAERLLFIPDLLGYWLTGRQVAERTIASTSGLLDARTGGWAQGITNALGLPDGLLPPVSAPGDELGGLVAPARQETGLGDRVEVTTVGSHDTASAVLGVPAESDEFAYISCGTWALTGVEIESPVLDDRALAANFTNETGVDDTIRFLRNSMGLWVLSESVATWRRAGLTAELPALLAAAAALPTGGPTFDVDAAEFLPPGDMPARVVDACRASGGPVPHGAAEIVRCIIDSLAATLARDVHNASALTGRKVRTIHLVGGGARNALLCQLTADLAGLPVVAGPVEATAIGNVLVQARTHGVLAGDRFALRELIRRTQELTRYEPRTRRTGGAQ